MTMQRLDKLLASQGLGSRKEVGALLRAGRVTVDGDVVRSGESKVDGDAQRIVVDGTVISYRQYLYLMMNKPAGVISASSDPKARTVVDLVPPALHRRGLFPAGRLDKDTTGLLILTDDGDFAHRMLSPKKGVDKLYHAVVDAPITQTEIEAFRKGIVFADGTVCLPAGLLVLQEGENPLVQVCIREGKFHQVKKMFLSVGRTVLALRRVQIGALKLDQALAEGECRELTQEELKFVFQVQKQG